MPEGQRGPFLAKTKQNSKKFLGALGGLDSKALLGNCLNRMYIGESADTAAWKCTQINVTVSSSMFQGDRTQVMEKRFREFLLVAENAEAVLGARVDTAREGSYQLLGDVLTRFSDHCTNTGTSHSVMIMIFYISYSPVRYSLQSLSNIINIMLPRSDARRLRGGEERGAGAVDGAPARQRLRHLQGHCRRITVSQQHARQGTICFPEKDRVVYTVVRPVSLIVCTQILVAHMYVRTTNFVAFQQSSLICFVPSTKHNNFAPPVAHHFCLNLPAAFSQPGNDK